MTIEEIAKKIASAQYGHVSHHYVCQKHDCMRLLGTEYLANTNKLYWLWGCDKCHTRVLILDEEGE